MTAPSAEFAPGSLVEAHSLAAAPVLNGLRGRATRIQGERVVVVFPQPHGEKALRPVNLRLTSEQPVKVNGPVDEILRWKSVLEQSPLPQAADLLAAMDSLEALGPLSTKVLAETKVGVVVGALAKHTSLSEKVCARARALVNTWRDQHRRHQQADVGSFPPKPSEPAFVTLARQNGSRREDRAGSQGTAVKSWGDRLSGKPPSPPAHRADASESSGIGSAGRKVESLSASTPLVAAPPAESLRDKMAKFRQAQKRKLQRATSDPQTPEHKRKLERRASDPEASAAKLLTRLLSGAATAHLDTNRSGIVPSKPSDLALRLGCQSRLQFAKEKSSRNFAPKAGSRDLVPKPSAFKRTPIVKLGANVRESIQKKILEALEKAEDVQTAEGDLPPVGHNKLTSLAEGIENEIFCQLEGHINAADYRHKARSVIFNLKDKTNTTFGYKVLAGMLRPLDIPMLTADEMASAERSELRAKLRKEAAEEIEIDWDRRHNNLPTSSTFTCGKCKKNKTTYYQMQTRSADEPMTTFVICLNCKNRWKFC